MGILIPCPGKEITMVIKRTGDRAGNREWYEVTRLRKTDRFYKYGARYVFRRRSRSWSGHEYMETGYAETKEEACRRCLGDHYEEWRKEQTK